MRTVFESSMVAHVWAQQSQQSGRTASGNLYFEGPALFSYWTHYCVGLFAAPGGPVFINSTGNSVTTNGHVRLAWGAARHLKPHGIPDLEDVRNELRRAGLGRADDSDRARLVRYLESNWSKLSADSEGAAWIYRKAGKRGTWAAFRARLERAKAKADAEKAERLRRYEMAQGREFAALPWPVIRWRAARMADSIYARELRSFASDLRAARLATPKAHKRIRSTLWRREQAVRAMAARTESTADRIGYASKRTKGLAAIAALRQWFDGRVGSVPGFEGPDHGPERLRAALELPNGAGVRTLSNRLREVLASDCIPLPPAMRERFEALQTWADGLATAWEGEELQRQHVREARRKVRQALEMFNRDRRHFAYVLRAAETPPAVDPVTGGSYAPPSAAQVVRAADAALARVPVAVPYNAERGLQIAPALAARAARIAARALELVESIEAAAAPYRTERDRIEAERRAAERAEAARIAAMSPAEILAAWGAGELSARHSAVRSLEIERGPLLRAVAPEVSGCNVTGGTLETSQGATVPLRHAFRVFQFVAACRAERKAWTPGCGFGPGRIRVGHFALDRIDSTGNFVAGCHSIKWAEVSRLAEALGVADCLATLPEVTAELAELA